MNLPEILARIETRLTAVGLKADAASKLAKKPDAIRNIRRAVKDKGNRAGVSTATIAALAVPLRCSASWLLTGEGSEDKNSQVPVMGRVGAGAEIMPEFEQLPPEGLFEIDVLIPMPEGAIAFEVEGSSMWPRYDPGDVVICWREGTNIEGVLGHEAAVRTADGRRFLKRVLRGSSPETYDLESHNAEPIRGVKLEWVSGVEHVVRSGKWKKLSATERRRLIGKALT